MNQGNAKINQTSPSLQGCRCAGGKDALNADLLRESFYELKRKATQKSRA